MGNRENRARDLEKQQKMRGNKNLGLAQRISSYVICLKNVCLQVRAPPPHPTHWEKKGFLKRFTALCYIRYLAFASHLLLLAIRAKKRNKEVGRLDRAKEDGAKEK